MPQIEFHPLAELFPLMEGAEFKALMADISERGLREPIILLDEKILDGRNRYRACREAELEPIYREFSADDGDPRAFVISKNLHRRHLNESQRAMIAARLYKTHAGDNQHTIEVTGIPVTSRGDAAKLLNVHHTTVTDAKKVLSEGTADEIEAVERGEAAVSTVAGQIRASVPKAQRAKKRDEPLSQSGKNPERIQRQQMQADIWARLSDAILGLTNLPSPIDVVEIVRGNINRRRVVDDKLERSLQWLTEFSDAWNGNDHE